MKDQNKVSDIPKKDFWSLGGSLRSEIKLSNKELRKSRHNWGTDKYKLTTFDKILEKKSEANS